MELSVPGTMARPRRALAAPLALVALVALALTAPGAATAADVTVLQSTGDLFIVKDGAPTPAPGPRLPGGAVLQSGAEPEPAQREALTRQPAQHAAALFFGPGQVVTLVTGATAVRAGSDETPAYTLSGAAHLLFDSGAEQARAFSLNGVTLRARQVHLFFDGWTDPPTALVISGEAELESGGATVSAGRGQTIVLDPAGVRVEGQRLGAGESLPGDPLREWATLAGYEAPGPFRRVGTAIPSDRALRLNRNERISRVEGARIPVFEGDQLLSEDGQKVRIEFDSGDKVRLTNKTVFKVDEYLPERREKPSILFSMLGKVRALIVSRFEPDSVRFKTGTATIGVKGTDFNVAADEAATTVETLDGTVGLSDPAGAGEVLVAPGLQSTVAQGALPAEPTPIPPERRDELQGEAMGGEELAAAAAATVPLAAAPPAPAEALPPAPPAPAEALPPAPPEPAPAVVAAPAPAGDPCVRLRQSWLNSIATQTGAPLDERYLDLRGVFACAGMPRTPAGEGVPADLPYHPERGAAAGMASQLDETFLNDLR